jgi:hypothetical protein
MGIIGYNFKISISYREDCTLTIYKRVNLQQTLIDFTIENHREYVSKMEELLDLEIVRFNDGFEEETKDWDEDLKNEYGEHLSDEYWTLAETHPSLLRSSMLTSSYSLFEKALKDLAHFYEKKIIKPSGYDSTITTKSKISKYLKRIERRLGIDFSVQIREWKLIEDYYRELRNTLVHDGGEVDVNGEPDKLKYLEVLKVEIKGPSNELVLQKELCINFLTVISTFFQEFFRLIENQKQG